MTITEFLLARIEEDEVLAGPPNDWQDPPLSWSSFGLMVSANRVLAECAAKRKVVAMHSRNHDCPLPRGLSITYQPEYDPTDACPTLCALATVYADHPDYWQEWPA